MKYIVVNKNIVNDSSIIFHIDTPNPTTKYSETVLFSGWAFSPSGGMVSMTTEYLNSKKQEALNVSRKDVVEHFTKNSTNTIPPLECGFSFSINADSKIIIFSDGIAMIEINLSVIDTEIKSEWALLEKLNEAHLESTPEIINEQDLVSLSVTPYKYIGNNPSELTKACWIPTSTRENLNIFIENARSPNFGPQLVESALANGFIKIASPLHTNTDAYCRSSFYVAPFNFLRFVSNGDVFYLIQHFSFCDAIYIPKLGIHHFLSAWINKSTWHGKIEQFTLLYDKKSEGVFNSVLAMHHRPYHYNYDIALGLHLLNKHGLLEKIPLLALHEEKAYFRPSKLINHGIKEVIFNENDFKSHLNQPGFSILAGYQITHSAKEATSRALFTELDFNIRNNNTAVFHSEFVNEICTNLNKSEVRIWFGITSQKRKLVNQEEEIAKTIKIFSKIFNNISVVIDGWTSPLKKSENDVKEIESDLLVAEAIQKLVGVTDVSFHSAIGLTTEEKLTIIEHIDVFLANHGAGSMHIDRMGNKFGVTHNSNIWSAADFAHIHNNSIKIDQRHIIDSGSIDKGQDYVDYSVAPKVIAQNMLLQYFNSINNKQDAS